MASKLVNSNRALIVLALICAVLLGTGIKLFYWQHFTFDKFIDRDIFRGISPDASFWIEGSELSGGGRTPGGAMNVLMYILYRLSFGQVVGIYLWFCLFHFLGILWISLSLKSHFGKTTAWTAAALMSVGYVFLELFIVLWNPTFSFVFFCGAFGLTLTMFILNRHEYLPYITALIAVSSQLHLSNIVLLPVVFITAAVLRFKWPWRTLLWSLASFFLLYSPFILREVQGRSVFFDAWHADPTLSFGAYAEQYMKVILNYSNVIFFSDNPGLQWSHRTSFEGSIFSSSRFALVAISLLPLICIFFVFLKKNLKESEARSVRVLKTLFLVSLLMLLPALLVSYSNQEISYRRFLWVAPFFVAISSLGFAQITSTSFLGHNKRGVAAVSSLVLLYSLTQIIYIYNNESVTQRQESFLFKKELVDTARKEFKFTDYEIEHQIGLIAKDDYNGVHGDYIIKTSQRNDGSGLKVFLNGLMDYQEIGSLSDQCLLAIRDSSEKSLREVKYSNDYLSQLMEKQGIDSELIHIGKISHGEEASYFSYRKIQNNCFQFFTNYYYVPEKHLIEKTLNPSNPFVANGKSTGSAHRFAFRHDVDQRDYYFVLGLETNWEYIVGTLFMDTKDFIPFESLAAFEKDGFLADAQLILNSNTGKGRYTLPLFGFSGGLKKLFSSPLFFKLPKPPPDSYTLEIEIPQPDGSKFIKLLTETFSTLPPAVPPTK